MRGWTVLATPAVRGPAGSETHLSGGVAIIARIYLGLHTRGRPTATLVEGRVAAAVLQLPGGPEVEVCSVYLHGGEGLGEVIRRITEAIGIHMAEHAASQFIIGGDMQQKPDLFLEAGMPAMLGARVSAVDAKEGTCRKARGGVSNLDWF